MANFQVSSFLYSSRFVGLSGFNSISLCQQYCVNDLCKDFMRKNRNLLRPSITGLKMESIYSQIAILNYYFMVSNEIFLVLIKLIVKNVLIDSAASLYHDKKVSYYFFSINLSYFLFLQWPHFRSIVLHFAKRCFGR